MDKIKTFSPLTRLLSLVLSLLIMFYVAPITVSANEDDDLIAGPNESGVAEDLPADEVSSADNQIGEPYEVVSLREENVKHFKLPDGSYVAAQYDYPVHFLDEYGDYVDIDNRLSDSGSEFSTENARVKFIKKITGSGNIFTLHENNAKITMGLVGAEKKTAGVVTSGKNSDDYIEDALGKLTNLENISSTIRYSDILDGVDIEYIVHSLNIKENIIVKERKDSYSYTFTVELNNLTATLFEDGNVYITGEDGEIKYVIPAPIVYDSEKNYAPSEVAEYTLTETGNGKYELIVTVSAEWMNDEARAFPVTIDPPIEGVQGNLVDLYVDSSSPNSSFFGENYLEVSGTEISYLKFNDSYFRSIPQGATIMMAELSIIGSSEIAKGAKVGIYPVLSSWNSALTYNKTLSPSNQGMIGSNAIDYEILDVGDKRRSFDITELYEGWVNGESNYGVALKLLNNSSGERAYFFSYEYYTGEYDDNFYEPVLLVTYIYNDGLESYFPTSTHSAGVGGAGSINLATGRLTLAIPTLTTTDSLFGFTPTLVYNSSIAGKPLTNANVISPFSTSYLPYGFKLNLQEFIQRKSYIDGEGVTQTYYALYDADGTTHTLYSIGGVIRDDSGLGLTLTTDGGSLVITDKSHTKKTYTSYGSSNWYLTSVTDNFGNKLIFSFDSSYRPTSVKVKPVDKSEIVMLSFVYSGNMLSAVYNSTSSDFVRLNYSGNYLSAIEYGKGDLSSTAYASATYSYDSNGYITEIKDNTANTSVKYDVSQGKITKISEFASGATGQKVSYTYGKRYSEVRTTGNDESLGNDDDIITRYVFDRFGRAISVHSMSTDGEIYGATMGEYEASQLAKNSISKEYIVNVREQYKVKDGNNDASATIYGGINKTADTGSRSFTVYEKPDDVTYNANMRIQISAIGRAESITISENAMFGIGVRVYYLQSDGTHIIETEKISFLDAEGTYQFVSGVFDCKIEDSQNRYNIVDKIELVCYYYGQLPVDGQEPQAEFKNLSFVECSEFDTARYTYDAKGNIAIKTIGTYEEYYEYDKNGNVIRIANNRGELYNYSYNANNTLSSESYYTFCRTNVTGNLLYIYPYDRNLIENPDAIIDDPSIRNNIDPYLALTTISSTSYTYNSYGLVTCVFSHAGLSDSITSSYTYVVDNSEYANYSNIFGALSSETDSRGYVTKYFYDSTNGNLLAEIDVSTGSGYVYTYDEIGRLEKVTPASGSATSYSGVANAEEVEYTYDSAHRLSKINTATTEYTFTYDIFGNSTSVSAGNNTLATYEYYPNNGKLKKINYGNGFSEEYVYGDLEKATEVWYNYSNGTRAKAYSYAYNEDGSLHSFTNHLNGEVVIYEYDYAGRFVSSSETKASNSGYKNQYSVDYDEFGRVSHATNIIDYLVSSTVHDATLKTEYAYNTNGTLKNTGTTLPGGGRIVSDYSYGEFNRLAEISHRAGSFNQDISYEYYSYSNKSIGLITGYTSTVNGTATTLGYTYDSKGNITKITNSGDDDITYTYDDLGQLTKEVKGNVTKTYTYDNAGNIKSIITMTQIESLDPDPGFTPIIKAVGTLPKVTITTKTLTYGNSQWGDLLTSYDGTAITYDEIGNPLSYYNGTSYTFTWEGRRLVGAVKGTKTMSFSYNDEGIRTSKTVDGVTTTYYVNGGQIVAEKTDTRTIVYIYDASGAPIGMMYRTPSYAANTWDTFWYEKNLQGDIIAVYNSEGTKVATYTYSDALGNHSVSYSNSGASTGVIYNPFRYRGYYYDTDLGMYYLQSRYYDAKICRFINADSALYHGMLGYNMSVYCNNSPVNYVDPAGNFAYSFVGDTDDLDYWALEGAGAGGGGATGNYFGYGTAYYNYLVHSNTASYDAYLGGYHYGGGVYIGGYTSQFYVGNVSVNDSMAKNFNEKGACFIEGTMVKTAEGNVPIEDIEVGDLVYAHNPETGETELKTVVNTFINEATELVHVFANGEEIICTNEHPFYSPVKGWIEACQLHAGDILLSLNGEYIVVEQVQHEILEAPIKVYNFEVEDFHTYFVGDGNGVLVHNECGWSTVVESKSAYATVKTLDQQQTKIYEEALTKLASGNTTSLHIHRLTTGDYAADLKGIGKGRGAGRIIYQSNGGVIEILDVSLNHYK